MATRRPTEPPRSPDLSKEIPNVIKADEKLAPKAPRAKSATPRAKKPAAAAAKAPTAVAVSEDVRRGMIAEGAYLRAERRGFAPGHEAQDWLDAETEVDALLKARVAATSQYGYCFGGAKPLEYSTFPSGVTKIASYCGIRLMISNAFSGPSTKAVFDIPSVSVAVGPRMVALRTLLTE